MLLFFMMKHIFKNNKEHYTYGGLYGSSGSYILGKIAREFNTVFIVLSNNSEIVNLSKELNINDILLLDDGRIELKVEKISDSKN